jgi:hypothetical protein
MSQRVGVHGYYSNMHSIRDREAVVAAFDALQGALNDVIALDFDALTTRERFALLERIERVRRRLPVAEHELLNGIGEHATPADIGGKLPHVVADRLRITRGEASRRIQQAQDLGSRRSLIGEPLPPRLPPPLPANGMARSEPDTSR